MKKELVFSLVIHILVIGVYPTILLSKKTSPYPASVYQVSLFSLPTATPATSIIDKSEEKAKAAEKPKKTEEPQKAPKSETNTQSKGQISTQQTDFKYSYYLDIILTKIGENWRNPCEGEGGKISAVIYFVVQRNGTIEKVKIEKSSGNYYFDQAAMRAVSVTKQLPPLPDEFERGWLGVYFEFEYVEK